MNKKLILLMLALPLILMLSLFTATSTVSLTISVPVERIEISSENVVYLNLDEGETYTVEYTVYPTNAANKEVSFSTEKVGSNPLAELEYNEGVITPKTCGQARVILTTVDGGFTDNFIVQVDSRSLQAIESTISETTLDIGQTTTIATTFTPKNAPNKQLRYEIVEGADVVSVNNQGVITGLSVGTAKIKVISRMNEAIFDEVEIEVKNSAAMQFVTKAVTNTMQQTGGSIPLYVDSNVEFTYTLEVVDGNGVASTAIEYTLDKANQVLNYTFLDVEFEGKLTLHLTVTVAGMDAYEDNCTITRIRKIQAAWDGADSIAIKVGSEQHVYLTITPPDVEIEYSISYENDQGYISVTQDIENGQLVVKAIKANEDFAESYTDIVLKVWAKNNPDEVITLTLTVNVY